MMMKIFCDVFGARKETFIGDVMNLVDEEKELKQRIFLET